MQETASWISGDHQSDHWASQSPLSLGWLQGRAARPRSKAQWWLMGCNPMAKSSWHMEKYILYGCFSKNRGVSPKMDGENNGKPFFELDDFGGKPTVFGNIHIIVPIFNGVDFEEFGNWMEKSWKIVSWRCGRIYVHFMALDLSTSRGIESSLRSYGTWSCSVHFSHLPIAHLSIERTEKMVPNLVGNIVWDHLFAVKKWAGSPPTQLELRLGLLVLTFPPAIQLDRQDHDEDHPSADSTGEMILIYYQLLKMLDILFCLFAICWRTLTACWQAIYFHRWAQTLVSPWSQSLKPVLVWGKSNWSLGSLSQLVFGL